MQGTAVETVPADAAAAEQWRADLRARLFAETVERGNEKDIAPFREYENWCASQGLHALPVRVAGVTLYFLSLLRGGTPKYELSSKAYGFERIHTLAKHPPRDLSKQVLNGLFRALEFAKLELPQVMGLVEDRDQQAARARPWRCFRAAIFPSSTPSMSDRREKIEALLHSPIEGERKAAEAALGRLNEDKPARVALAPLSEDKPAYASPEWHAAIQEWCRKLEFCVSRLGSPTLTKAEVVLIRNWSRGRGDPWASGSEQIKAVHHKLAGGQPVEALTDQVGNLRVG